MSYKPCKAIGLMSGTSLDGLDICLAEFIHTDQGWHFNILEATTIGYDQHWMEQLSSASSISGIELPKLDHSFGNYLGQCVNHFLEDYNISPDSVNLVASHGHTLFHKPDQGFTYQLGNGPELMVLTGITTVCDFRRQDVAMGGQGAPLVPVGDELLFSKYQSCLNLGGFANISLKEVGARIAFDICPVNIVLNAISGLLGYEYDDGGKIADSGKVNDQLLKELDSLLFYHQSPPKSLGAEWVQTHFEPCLAKYVDQPEDTLATLTEHAATQISSVINKYGIKECLVTGGGAYNSSLLRRIRQKSSCKLVVPEDALVQFKEALIFAFMGYLKTLGEINVYSSVTGSSADHSSGVIYNP